MPSTPGIQQAMNWSKYSFDINQIKLIRAKINSIRGAALAGEVNDNNTDDVPGGHEVL
jgi:hypothetical protein